MSDLLEDGSFMFTSESVGEGHPGDIPEILISVSSGFLVVFMPGIIHYELT